MKKVIPLIIALAFASMSGASAQLIVKTIDQSELTTGWVNVYELPANGGGWYDGGPSAVADLRAQFPLSNEVIFSPNTTNNPSLYTPGPGGEGNKMMDAFLLASASDSLSGTLQFSGNVVDFSLATNGAGIPYNLTAVIRDFAPDYSSVNETYLPITTTGEFSLSLNLINAPGRHVQWGLRMFGPNIWPGNTAELANAGSVTVIPEPSTYALLGLAAVGGLLARRFRRKA